MINWLTSLGLPANGDLYFVTVLVAGVLAITIVLLICSMLFGIATNIFRR